MHAQPCGWEEQTGKVRDRLAHTRGCVSVYTKSRTAFREGMAGRVLLETGGKSYGGAEGGAGGE